MYYFQQPLILINIMVLVILSGFLMANYFQFNKMNFWTQSNLELEIIFI